MTELVITSVGDTWVNSGKAGQNYGSVKWVQVQSGSRYAFVKPHLGNIADRTVVDAYLVGRSQGTVAQTLTIAPVTQKWAAGKVTWNNQPAVNTAAQVSVAIPALAAGASFELTGLAAMLQAVADGTDYHGFRITTSYATSPQRFYSADSGEPSWELHVELSDAPEQPTDLRPNGGAVGSSSPILAWTFLDLGGDSVEQASFRVQIDTPAVGAEPDEVTPDLDTGYITSADPQYAPTYAVTGAGPHYWRVQVRDATPNTSEWSDWAEFTVSAAPALVVDSPTGPFGDPTPTVLAHLSTGTLSAWQAIVTGPDRSDVRARSGLVAQAGGTIAWTIPLREDRADGRRRKVFRGEGPFWLHLRAWDSVARVAAVGQQPYVETWAELSFDDDLGVQAPTGLQIGAGQDGGPVREWSWQRTEAADAWVITINGDVVERLTSEEVTVSAGRYTWTDSGHVAPLRPQEIALHAVEGDLRSVPAVVSVTPPMLSGVWLIPDDPAIGPIVFNGTGVDDWRRLDYRATYVTSTGEEVDVEYGKPGRVGSFEGTVDSRGDAWETLRRIEALRRSPNRLARLVWPSHSIPVRVRDIDANASGNILPNNLEHVARFGFVELDD